MPRMLGDLDELLNRIDSSIQSEIQQTRDRKQDRVEHILNEARQKAEKIEKEARQQAEAQAERRKAALRAQAERNEKEARLRQRDSDLDEVWARATEKIKSMIDSEEYQVVLRQLTQEALGLLGPGSYRLAADSKGHQLLTQERLDQWAASLQAELEGELTFTRAQEPADIWGGLIIEDKDHPRRVDASFAARLTIAREEIGDEIFDEIEANS